MPGGFKCRGIGVFLSFSNTSSGGYFILATKKKKKDSGLAYGFVSLKHILQQSKMYTYDPSSTLP